MRVVIFGANGGTGRWLSHLVLHAVAPRWR